METEHFAVLGQYSGGPRRPRSGDGPGAGVPLADDCTNAGRRPLPPGAAVVSASAEGMSFDMNVVALFA